jgi:hypothetical protein
VGGVGRNPHDSPPGEVYRITAVPQAHSDDLRNRMNRYLVSMGIRTVCVILVVIVHGPARWAFAAGALVLPYVAVVMANAARHRRGDPLAAPTPRRRAVAGPPSGPLSGPAGAPGTAPPGSHFDAVRPAHPPNG